MAIAKEKPKYDAEYHLGNTLVLIRAPDPMPEEERKRRFHEYQQAEWEAWNMLSVEERLKINAECAG